MLKSGLAVLTVAALATGAQAAEININFGNAVPADGEGNPIAGGDYWNNLTGTGSSIADLVDSTGVSTGFSIAPDSTFRFGGTNTNGTTTPGAPASAYFPMEVTRSSFYGHTEEWTGNDPRPLAVYTLSNLDSNTVYDLRFFASRSADDNRTTEYLVQGAGEAVSDLLDTASNVEDFASVSGILADENGDIVISIREGVGNNNSSGFFYLGGIVVETTVVPEPASLGLLAAGGVMLLRRRRA